MTAVALALASAALFGAMTVLVRLGLRRAPAAPAAAAATVLPALLVALVGVAVAGRHDLAAAWPFLLAGLLAPGGSQIFFTLAIGAAGASRSSVVVGAAPVAAVAIALVALGEPVSAPLVLGAVLVVGGGVALALERGRPEDLRAAGLAFAALAAVLFAARDNLVRHLAGTSAVPPTAAAAATLLSGALVAAVWARRLPSRRTLGAFAPAGVCFGLSYLALFEAYYRGRVSVVSPLVATETLFGVGLSALFLRQELVGRRLLAGAALIVAGAALIGVFR